MGKRARGLALGMGIVGSPVSERNCRCDLSIRKKPGVTGGSFALAKTGLARRSQSAGASGNPSRVPIKMLCGRGDSNSHSRKATRT